MQQLKQLTSFEAACQVLGLDPGKVIPDFSCFPAQDHRSMIAHAKLVLIIRAANQLANGGKEWKPDFDNYDQWKYEAWFSKDEKGGSSGFRFNAYDDWHTASHVGSRLCFISREVAKYVATTFVDLYNEYLL